MLILLGLIVVILLWRGFFKWFFLFLTLSVMYQIDHDRTVHEACRPSETHAAAQPDEFKAFDPARRYPTSRKAISE